MLEKDLVSNTKKTLLMVAFEFPPSNGSSVPRIESFYKYLKLWGWEVIVLTANPRAYQRLNNDYEDNSDDHIYRAFALDAPRHLSIKGKYLSALERPDRWGLTWIPSALKLGKKLLKKYKPDIIWSSSPIPSSHYIAGKLATKTNIPWIADYRDPFHYMNGSAGAALDKLHKKIDELTLNNARKLIFATDQVKQLYYDKYGETVALKSSVIENGFDELNFAKLKTLDAPDAPFDVNKFSLYYSGVLYSKGRDPSPIFRAIQSLCNKNIVSRDNFEFIFQGAGSGDEFKDYLKTLGIDTLVRFIEPVNFMEALSNMMKCDALVLIQDERFNKQIPGKVYEYLRTQKPLLVKSHQDGATYKLVAEHDGTFIGYTDKELERALIQLLQSADDCINRDVSLYSREYKSRQLLDVLSTF